MTDPLIAEEPAVSRRRLWLGVLVPPGVWVVHGLTGFFLAVGLCRSHHVTLARILILCVTAAAAAACVAAGVLAWGSWRALRDGQSVAFAEARGQDEWFASVGVYSAAIFTLGVLWGGLQAMVMGGGLCHFTR